MNNTDRTILLVEDEVLIAMAEERQLAGAGYNVITAFSGEDAIAIAVGSEQRIDLVLMDIDLGRGIDGTQAAMEILKHRDIPVLFQSSHTEKDIIEKTEKITSYGYVVKHSGITILDASIKMAFKLHKAYTDLKEKEESLLVKERAIESSINAVAISDPSTRVIYANPSFLKLWEYDSVDEVLNLKAADFWVNNGEASVMLEHLFRSGIWRGEVVCRKKNGVLFDVETSASIIYGQNKKPVGIIAAFQDITERKHSEASIRESRERYRVLVENIDSLVCETDSNGRYTYLSPAYRKVTGYEPDELLGKQVMHLLHPDELTKWRNECCSCIRPNHSIRDTWRFMIKNGEWKWFDCSITFFEKTPGETRAVVISNDITERIDEEKRMERIIRENEIYLKELRDRVVNNAVIINTFIDFLIARFADDRSKQVFMQTESRIRFCISLYQKFHTSPGPSGVNLYNYIEDIIDSITIIDDERKKHILISSELSGIMIDIKWILPLGLILNELITNAVKYAYPGNKNGEISICHECGNNRITLCVIDRGIGFTGAVDSDSSFNIGVSLAREMTERIGGELTFSSDSGTSCFISFTP